MQFGMKSGGYRTMKTTSFEKEDFVGIVLGAETVANYAKARKEGKSRQVAFTNVVLAKMDAQTGAVDPHLIGEAALFLESTEMFKAALAA